VNRPHALGYRVARERDRARDHGRKADDIEEQL
jgi:hypothetical protein